MCVWMGRAVFPRGSTGSAPRWGLRETRAELGVGAVAVAVRYRYPVSPSPGKRGGGALGHLHVEWGQDTAT